MVLQHSRLVRLLVAITLVALATTGLRLSEGDEDTNFEIVRGVLGESLTINGGTVTASQVKVGTALVRYDQISARTPGLFVAVRVQVAGTGTEAVPLFDARVYSGKRRYDSFGFRKPGGSAPGLEESLDVVFEVDPATIDDLTLELDPVELLEGYSQNVRIHLGITPANADQWREAGREQVIEAAERTLRGI
jgi:hypothetical protein